jgi:hypothetical protein
VRGSTRLRLEPDLVTVAGSNTIRTRALRPPTCNACSLTHAGFRLVPFRSPLLGESRLISFPRGTEMCQFPRLPSIAYVFSNERRRITGAGLPHSEIRGSMPVQRLTAAYRSRPRPSSAPGAKASTVCPYYLDGELCVLPTRAKTQRSHETPEGAPWVNTHLLLLGCSFQAPPRSAGGGLPPGGLSKLSSVDAGARPTTRPVVARTTYGRRSGRHLENVSLERR